MLSVPAVHLDDGGLAPIGIGIRARATECLSPVSGESLNMLGVEAVAERMGDHVVGHHSTMPGVGKTAQAVVTTRRLEDSLHASIMTFLPCLCKTMPPQFSRAAPSNGTSPLGRSCPMSRYSRSGPRGGEWFYRGSRFAHPAPRPPTVEA